MSIGLTKNKIKQINVKIIEYLKKIEYLCRLFQGIHQKLRP